MFKIASLFALLTGVTALLAQAPSEFNPRTTGKPVAQQLPGRGAKGPAPGTTPTTSTDKPTPAAPAKLPSDLVNNPAPGPDLRKLRTDVEKLKALREALDTENKDISDKLKPEEAADAETTRLRLHLAELLAKMSARTTARSGGPNSGPLVLPVDLRDGPSSAGEAGLTGQALDHLHRAQALFQAGDFAGALQVYRAIPLTGLRPAERAPVQYMIATCHRKLGSLDEAANGYREVAAAKGDDFIADCAQWQLNALSSRRDMESKLQGMKKKLEGMEDKP